ncbi:MAG: RNA polymerase sigma factor, partial [Bryobacteraceae bacterium]
MNDEHGHKAAAALEDLARMALEGNREALERLVEELQGDVFGLALRMLGNREDAEDAAQEILIRIVTRLAQFDFRSQLKTWAYRIAVNHVLDLRKSPAEKQRRGFRELSEAIAAGLGPEAPAETDRSRLIAEGNSDCTLGMLQCLDRA